MKIPKYLKLTYPGVFYTKGKQDTSNARDNVFSDSLANQLATITGNITEGYTLTHLITVNA